MDQTPRKPRRRRPARPRPTHEEILRILREHMPELCERYHVRSLDVFGSYVRGEQRPRSDLDVLVEYDEVPGLIEFVQLQFHLSDLVGVKVDLVSRGALRGRIGERILREKVEV